MLTIAPVLLAALTTLTAAQDRAAKPAGGGLAGIACGCPGDFDHSGTIDGADLATLLGGWGSTGTDLNADGNTDAADLGILLGGWGSCGSAPVNDLCIDALPIVEGDTPFCTIGANTDAPPYSQGSACSEFGYDTMTSDVWYLFTAPDFGKVTLSTCGATWDTRLAVYAHALSAVVGCPTGGFDFVGVIACNDDAPGCATASQLTFDTIPGKQYKIRVGGYLGWSGEGTLHLNFDPIGSSCATAIELGGVLEETIFGTTLDVDYGADESPCGLGDTAAKWFKFIPDGCILDVPTITISTCFADTDFDTTISVWKADASGCPSEGFGEFIVCNDDFTSPDCQIGGLNRKSRVQFDAPGIGAYYIRVSGYNGARGDFRLHILNDCN
jgi:hypothetical protein